MAMIKFTVLSVVLFLGALILTPFPHYLPPDFDHHGFLRNKQSGFYRSGYFLGFYAHIATAPLALLCGTLQISVSLRRRWPRWHQRLGKAYVILVLGFAAPGGAIMSMRALGGGVINPLFLSDQRFCLVVYVAGVARGQGASICRARPVDVPQLPDDVLSDYVEGDSLCTAATEPRSDFHLPTFGMAKLGAGPGDLPTGNLPTAVRFAIAVAGTRSDCWTKRNTTFPKPRIPITQRPMWPTSIPRARSAVE